MSPQSATRAAKAGKAKKASPKSSKSVAAKAVIDNKPPAAKDSNDKYWIFIMQNGNFQAFETKAEADAMFHDFSSIVKER
jgi:hypothetical protein